MGRSLSDRDERPDSPVVAIHKLVAAFFGLSYRARAILIAFSLYILAFFLPTISFTINGKTSWESGIDAFESSWRVFIASDRWDWERADVVAAWCLNPAV